MDFSFTELYSLFGGFLGIILTLIILLQVKGIREIRVILSLTLLIASVIAIFGTMMYSGNAQNIPHIIRLDSPFVYLLGPACFFYTYATFKPRYRFRWIHLLHLLPFLLNLIEFIPFYLGPSGDKITYYKLALESGSVIMPHHYLLKTISLAVYLFLQVYFFLKYKKQIRPTRTDRLTISWFRIFILAQALALAGIVTDNLTGLHLFGDPYRFAVVVVVTFLYATTITLMFYPHILYGVSEKQLPDQTKYSHSSLNEAEKNAILLKLDSFLLSKQKPYCNVDLSLPEVARKLDIGLHQLSQVINEKTGFNFNDYLNKTRVEEAKRLLSSGDYRILTIESIAMKAGFKSKSPFYTAFKKHTGMTPKEFAAQKIMSADDGNFAKDK